MQNSHPSNWCRILFIELLFSNNESWMNIRYKLNSLDRRITFAQAITRIVRNYLLHRAVAWYLHAVSVMEFWKISTKILINSVKIMIAIFYFITQRISRINYFKLVYIIGRQQVKTRALPKQREFPFNFSFDNFKTWNVQPMFDACFIKNNLWIWNLNNQTPLI